MKQDTVARYCLILKTKDQESYYFDTSLGAFVKFDEKTKPKKAYLAALDFLTSNFANKEDLATFYGIDKEIDKVYITYQFKGEKKLSPVFNNQVWAHVAATYGGKTIDFSDEGNKEAFNEVYNEIANLDSSFANSLIDKRNYLINLSQKTIFAIVGLRAHENAIRMKETYGFSSSGGMDDRTGQIYKEDRIGFYNDLRRALSKYREFRTVYMNYCKFIGKKEEKKKEQQKPMKKALISRDQISIFDLLKNNNDNN